MLSDSKDDFPKLLFLDQNKWIDLSRAHYGDSKGEPFRDALVAVRKAVDDGRLVVPFSWVNMVEMEANSIAERRERLARFMVDLSCNRSILSMMTVRPLEVQNAVHAFFGHPEPILIRRSLIRRGFAHALGMRLRIKNPSAKNEADVLHYIESTHASVQYLLAQGKDREEIQQYREEETGILGFLEQVRKRSTIITLEQRRAAELFEYLGKGDVGKVLVATLREIGVSARAFFDRFATPAAFIQFFAGVYTLDIALSLALARNKELDHPIHRNDTRDLIGLSVAIPYSNIVVSEKYWCHKARSCKLDAKYRTTIITDAREIPARLADIGCL